MYTESQFAEVVVDLLAEMTGVEWTSNSEGSISTPNLEHITVRPRGPNGALDAVPTSRDAGRVYVYNVHPYTYDSVAQWRSCLALELKLALQQRVEPAGAVAARLLEYHAGPAQVAAEEAAWAATRYGQKK